MGTLLSGTTLAWFAPLLEQESPLLNSFEEIISEFKARFMDTNKVRVTIKKIQKLRQGDRPTSTYASDFCLHTADIPWDDVTLMKQFRYGLRNDVKDLLLNTGSFETGNMSHFRNCLLKKGIK